MTDFFTKKYNNTREHIANRHKHHNVSNECVPKRDRANAFINIGDASFLLNDYLHGIKFQQVDRSLVTDCVTISTNEPEKTIVNISIDNTKPIFGNKIKYEKLLKNICNSLCSTKSNVLDILQKSLIVQLEYQLENQRTGEIIKSISEKLHMRNRNYFIDINVRSIGDNTIDNSIMLNFSDILTTTVTEFLHGSDKMICRLNKVKLYYQKIKPRTFCSNVNVNNDGSFNLNNSSNSTELYHFINNGESIQLHQDVIDNKIDNDIINIHIGTVDLGNTFVVNTGHKIVVKYMIWRSDIIMVKNCNDIHDMLKDDDCYHNHRHHGHHNPTLEDIYGQLCIIKETNYNQDVKLNSVINILDNIMTDNEAFELSTNIIKSYDK